MPQLNVAHLSKRFGGKQILKDISFSCRTNEILGLFGRNGSGKSTLLKCVFGTLKPNTIHITIDHTPIHHRQVISKARIAYLPQEHFLPKNIKVRDIIPIYFEDGARQDRIFYAPRIDRIENKKVRDLSQGQLRYFELLLIAFLDHDFIFLDEPFSMIEPLYIGLIKDFLIHLKQEKGIVITDHYYRDVLQIANRNHIIKDAMLFDVEGVTDLAKYGYLSKEP